MGRTSIPCSDETRDCLVAAKEDGETWDECLQRLSDDAPVERKDMGVVLDRLDEFKEVLGGVEESCNGNSNSDGDGDGGELDVNAVREAVRLEVRNGVEDALAEFAR